MLVFTLIAFVVCPLISFPFVIIGLRQNKKHRNIYLAIIAVFCALFSYSYQPTSVEDLYRHHIDTAQYENMSMEKFSDVVSSNSEQISIVYKYLISKTGNLNLLQFFTSAVSFFILLYLLTEYSSVEKEVRGWKLVGIWFFVLSGFHFLVITSGIFYTLALELFSLGVYMDYKKNRKLFAWILYIAPILIHTCCFLPFLVMILYKILGSRNNLRNMLLLAIAVLSIGFLMNIASSYLNIPLFSELSSLYKAYFGNEEYWSDLHSVPVLLLYLSRMLPVFGGRVISHSRDAISDFAIFMAVGVLILYLQTTFSIRYIHIVVLCGLSLIFEGAKDKKNGDAFCIMLYALGIPHIAYQLKQFSGFGEIKDMQRIFVTNLLTMLSGGDL